MFDVAFWDFLKIVDVQGFSLKSAVERPLFQNIDLEVCYGVTTETETHWCYFVLVLCFDVSINSFAQRLTHLFYVESRGAMLADDGVYHHREMGGGNLFELLHLFVPAFGFISCPLSMALSLFKSKASCAERQPHVVHLKQQHFPNLNERSIIFLGTTIHSRQKYSELWFVEFWNNYYCY